MQTGRAPGGRNPGRERAFTLLEIMMVVAIIGLMLTMGVPAILRTMNQEPLRKAVNDVVTICSHARAQAILHGVTTTIVFHPQSRQMALTVLATPNASAGFATPTAPAAGTQPASSSASALNATQFGDSITIDMLDVNLTEYKDADEARVCFFRTVPAMK